MMLQQIGNIEKGDFVRVSDDGGNRWYKVIGLRRYAFWGGRKQHIPIGVELENPDDSETIILVPLDIIIEHRRSYANLRKEY